MLDNAKFVGYNAKFKDIAEMSVDVKISDFRISRRIKDSHICFIIGKIFIYLIHLSRLTQMNFSKN